MTLADMQGENAFVIMANIGRLLGQLERGVPELKGLKAKYMEEATAGDYTKLCEVTETYAIKYLQATLQASEGDLTDLSDGDEWDDD